MNRENLEEGRGGNIPGNENGLGTGEYGAEETNGRWFGSPWRRGG